MNAASYVRIIGINELIYHSPFHFSRVQGDRRVGLCKIPHRASHCPAAATRDAGAADGEQPGLGEKGRGYFAERRGGRKMGGFLLPCVEEGRSVSSFSFCVPKPPGFKVWVFVSN